jgi:hypothetical protein
VGATVVCGVVVATDEVEVAAVVDECAVVVVVVLVGAASDRSAGDAAITATPSTSSTKAAIAPAARRRERGRVAVDEPNERDEAIPAGCRLGAARTRTPARDHTDSGSERAAP